MRVRVPSPGRGREGAWRLPIALVLCIPSENGHSAICQWNMLLHGSIEPLDTCSHSVVRVRHALFPLVLGCQY